MSKNRTLGEDKFLIRMKPLPYIQIYDLDVIYEHIKKLIGKYIIKSVCLFKKSVKIEFKAWNISGFLFL